jgi:hypothetical protein
MRVVITEKIIEGTFFVVGNKLLQPANSLANGCFQRRVAAPFEIENISSEDDCVRLLGTFVDFGFVSGGG